MPTQNLDAAHQYRPCVQFRKQGYAMVDWICSYYATVEQMPVRSRVEPGYLAPLLLEEAPETGESFEAIMRDVNDKVMPRDRHYKPP